MWLGHTKFSGWWRVGVLWLASRRMAADSPLLIRRCSWVNWRQLSAPNNAWTCSMVAAVRQHNCSAPRHTLREREGLLILTLGKVVSLLQDWVMGVSVAAATLPARWGPQTSRDETGRQLHCEPTDWVSSCGGSSLIWKPTARTILAARWRPSAMTSSNAFAKVESTSVKCSASGSVLWSKIIYWAAAALEGSHNQVLSSVLMIFQALKTIYRSPIYRMYDFTT